MTDEVCSAASLSSMIKSSTPGSEAEARQPDRLCKFCAVTPENGFTIEESDAVENGLIAFHVKPRPAGKIHLLVVPRDQHITSVKALDSSDFGLVLRMVRMAKRLLKEKGFSEEKQILAFHNPPSVWQLHLHAIGLPWTESEKHHFEKSNPRYVTASEQLGLLAEKGFAK
ncbi:hypothetical protein NliqN6_5968 [Naganishia liquefaciens]|uniref:HIT domain-containing protein n=1 Tax=Naganishia liquefaciens TaxID=104408 RepID=A0A8H3TXT6_9TREE|nr:hypothetical protein NliqN6_5968 [Naganishia liquefaciens]